MASKSYDLVVIGTGSAASTVASRCRSAGWTVAVIDSRPFGGTCAVRGCDPKKVLVAAAEALHWGHRLTGRGVEPGDTRIDWRELMAFKRTFTGPVPENHEQWFAEHRFVWRRARRAPQRVLHWVYLKGYRGTELSPVLGRF